MDVVCIHPSIRVSVHLSIRVSVHPSIYPCANLQALT